jgi:hypothetical protein
MIKLNSYEIKIREVKDLSKQSELETKEEKVGKAPLERPYVIDAKVYKLKSRFVEHSIFITIGYIKYDDKIRPFEIFINSKDLSRAAEFTMLTRLLSAIFRRFEDPVFILEELRSIYDPNRIGYWKNNRFIHSLYGEIAEVIEEFFKEMGIMKTETASEKSGEAGIKLMIEEKDESKEDLSLFQICPKCNLRTLKVEGGCYTCVNPECGYTKCD